MINSIDMTRKADSAQAVLSCKGLWKLFGDLPKGASRASISSLTTEELQAAGVISAVRDVELEILEGEIFVIMGLSGSGKSTTVRCLSRLVEPTFGEVLFGGRNLLTSTERELSEIRRHKMGMVFQHFGLLPHLDVLANVAFPLEIQGIPRTRREKRAREMIDLVGLQEREHYFPNQLSGGQQQRVGIARSLVVEPVIWLLDEPFSALDPLIRRDMQTQFLNLQERLRKSIVFITHDFDEAIRVADRIAIMKDGEIVQVGDAEEIVMAPATEYVKAFTRDVSRAKVVKVGSIMKPAAESLDATRAVAVGMNQKIDEVAETVVHSDGPVRVIDAAGVTVGALYRDDVTACFIASPRA